MTNQEIIMRFFNSWIAKDFSRLNDYFNQNAIYVESYGPWYQGLSEIKAWINHKKRRKQLINGTSKEFSIVETISILLSGISMLMKMVIPNLMVFQLSNSKMVKLKNYLNLVRNTNCIDLMKKYS